MRHQLALKQIREGIKVWKHGYRIMQNGNGKIIKGVHGFVIADLSKSDARSILDIGCGRAKLLRQIARMENFRNARLCGIDQDKKEIRWEGRLVRDAVQGEHRLSHAA